MRCSDLWWVVMGKDRDEKYVMGKEDQMQILSS